MPARNCAYGSAGTDSVRRRPRCADTCRMNRRRVSRANSGATAAASACSTASLMPRFRMVSIMPGMDWVAPERTLTSSGRGPRPNVREVSASSQRIRSSTSSQMASMVAAGSARYRRPTAVVMQNAGGTGRLCRRIASMPWPLLPRSSRGWLECRSATPRCSRHARPTAADALRWRRCLVRCQPWCTPLVVCATDRADVGTPAMFPHGPADEATQLLGGSCGATRPMI